MGGVRITVKTNASLVARRLGSLERRQMPFVMAKTLTRLAQLGRDNVKRRVSRTFKIRSRGILSSGFQIDRAEKRDWPKVTAAVGAKERFWVEHETGERKRPRKGARRVAIPTKFVTRMRTRTGRIPKRLKPRDLRRKPTTIVEDNEIRAKRVRGLARRLRFPIFHILRPSVRMKPVLRMKDTVAGTVKRHSGQVFTRTMRGALASRKGPRTIRQALSEVK